MGRKSLLIILHFGALVLSTCVPSKAQEKRNSAVISNSFATRWPGLPPIMKGIAVRPGGYSAACFDTDNLRCAADGWAVAATIFLAICNQELAVLLELQGFHSSESASGVSDHSRIFASHVAGGGMGAYEWLGGEGEYRGLDLNGERVVFFV